MRRSDESATSLQASALLSFCSGIKQCNTAQELRVIRLAAASRRIMAGLRTYLLKTPAPSLTRCGGAFCRGGPGGHDYPHFRRRAYLCAAGSRPSRRARPMLAMTRSNNAL